MNGEAKKSSGPNPPSIGEHARNRRESYGNIGVNFHLKEGPQHSVPPLSEKARPDQASNHKRGHEYLADEAMRYRYEVNEFRRALELLKYYLQREYLLWGVCYWY